MSRILHRRDVAAQPKCKTLVVTRDGEMLTGVGALATIAIRNPKYLYVFVGGRR